MQLKTFNVDFNVKHQQNLRTQSHSLVKILKNENALDLLVSLFFSELLSPTSEFLTDKLLKSDMIVCYSPKVLNSITIFKSIDNN